MLQVARFATLFNPAHRRCTGSRPEPNQDPGLGANNMRLDGASHIRPPLALRSRCFCGWPLARVVGMECPDSRAWLL
jgi:hypothetical protein